MRKHRTQPTSEEEREEARRALQESMNRRE